MAFLGHIISGDGVEVDPSKVEAVRDWPFPKSVTKIRSFLGLAGYYRKLIQGFSSIVVPLTTLTKKNVKFFWESEYQESFDRLKQALTLAPVLAMPSVQGDYVLYTDALKLGLGAVLMQHDRVIAYTSKYLKEEIQRFELVFYAKGNTPNLYILTVQSTLRDRIQAGQTSDE
ncbi:uncharacterized mitochondrial protein AtMg00860-like [Primulina huaijiensis]|uniref:uncharacterized mitochondrial protein AtMg00860-like n=1 Tax=Primulina huaijiensis TaxID=1492673 RepID=UPI003CC6F967